MGTERTRTPAALAFTCVHSISTGLRFGTVHAPLPVLRCPVNSQAPPLSPFLPVLPARVSNFPPLSPLFTALPYNSAVSPLSTAFTHCDRGVGVRPRASIFAPCVSRLTNSHLFCGLRTLCRRPSLPGLCFQRLTHSFCKNRGWHPCLSLFRYPGSSSQHQRARRTSRQTRTLYIYIYVLILYVCPHRRTTHGRLLATACGGTPPNLSFPAS
jgi:hypothetical protein